MPDAPDMLRQPDAAGLALVKSSEQCRLTAFDDKNPDKTLSRGDAVAGTLTIGWGHTGPDVAIGLAWTQDQADLCLLADLKIAELAIASLVTAPLSANQYDVLVDFIYNIGAGNFKASQLLSVLNQGRCQDVPAELARWVYAKGEKMPGLVARRAKEALLWSAPEAAPQLTAATAPSITPDSVKKPHILRSLTMAGAALAAAAPALSSAFQDTAAQIQPLIDYGHSLKLAFLGLSVGGAALAMYGRIAIMNKHGV